MHHAAGAVGFKCIAGSARRQIARGVALPVVALAAHLADFRSAVTLMDRAERRARLDGLQLPDIANHDHLCAGFGSMGQHALQLARADHACFVDYQDVAGIEHVAALSPAMLHAGDGA
jgi:hypothetical protein